MRNFASASAARRSSGRDAKGSRATPPSSSRIVAAQSRSTAFSVVWRLLSHEGEESIEMADDKQQNKDAQSGEPVQLDKEQAKPQPQPEGNEAGGQELGARPEGGQRKQ